MDRFKFRVWMKGGKFFYPLDDTYMKLKDGTVYDEEWSYSMRVGRLYEVDNFVLMQCTGLKDKNGVLIFEGDIVICDDVTADVTWFDGSFHILTDDCQSRSPLLQMRSKYFEVIGNIYENPELL